MTEFEEKALALLARMCVATERVASGLETSAASTVRLIESAGGKVTPPASRQPSQQTLPTGGGGAVFPNFGAASTKGQPVRGAKMKDLRWYEAALVRSVAQPKRAEYRAKDVALLTAIQDEIVAQGGDIDAANLPGDSAGSSSAEEPPPF